MGEPWDSKENINRWIFSGTAAKDSRRASLKASPLRSLTHRRSMRFFAIFGNCLRSDSVLAQGRYLERSNMCQSSLWLFPITTLFSPGAFASNFSTARVAVGMSSVVMTINAYRGTTSARAVLQLAATREVGAAIAGASCIWRSTI
jgi:hypothetical protein